MNSDCKNCGKEFEITDQDQAFYVRIEVPYPKFCSDCRMQRRLAFRNERHLYKRQCDLCEKNMISFFEAGREFPVYCVDCWWSDGWDPLEYGRDFDFSRGFFEQFAELMRVVPKMGLLQLNNENSEYNSALAYSKNTYMSPGSYFMEDCYFSRKSQHCKDCLDSNLLDHCELVKSGVNCAQCYNSHNILNCRNCRDCAYMADCTGCSYCFMCSGVARRQFCYKNKQYSEDEYMDIVKREMERDEDELRSEFEEFSLTVPKKYQNQINCEASSGDYLQNCKNAKDCYDCFDVEDSRYLVECVGVKDSMDLSYHDKDIELCYELCTGGESNVNTKFGVCPCASPGSEYLYSCFYLADSFGCDGFHGKQSNCILNKKYSPEEYKALRAKIIEHMKGLGEYGEFFPMEMSLYAYNESVAYDYFPITREEALSKGLRWKQEESARENVSNLSSCVECRKNFRVMQAEESLCKRMHVPVAKKCPDCRHKDLMSLKNPRKLWERVCSNCKVRIETTYAPNYAPNCSERVYCGKCYLEAVH